MLCGKRIARHALKIAVVAFALLFNTTLASANPLPCKGDILLKVGDNALLASKEEDATLYMEDGSNVQLGSLCMNTVEHIKVISWLNFLVRSPSERWRGLVQKETQRDFHDAPELGRGVKKGSRGIFDTYLILLNDESSTNPNYSVVECMRPSPGDTLNNGWGVSFCQGRFTHSSGLGVSYRYFRYKYPEATYADVAREAYSRLDKMITGAQSLIKDEKGK